MSPTRSSLLLRIPASLHQRLKQEARAADLSLNRYCYNLLSRSKASSRAGAALISPTLSAGLPLSLQDLSAAVLESWGDTVDGIVLFGSFARGRQTASSDIDLLIVLNRKVTLDRDIYARWRLHRFQGREVAPLFVHIPGAGERIGGLWFEVALDGIVLFDRDLQLSRFLSRARDVIADGRVKRRATQGHPYWVYCDQANGDSSSGGDS